MRKQPFHIVLVFSLTFNDDSYVKETQTELFFLRLQLKAKLEIGLLIIALYSLYEQIIGGGSPFSSFFIFPFFSPFLVTRC